MRLTDRLPRATGSPGRNRVGGVGLAATVLALVVTAGPGGAVAGFAVAAVWFTTPAVYAFAAGQALSAAVLPPGVPATELLLVQIGLFGILAAPVLAAEEPGRSMLAFGATSAALVGLVAWSGGVTDATWTIAGLLVGVVALAAYGIHRYERVRLGLVEGPP